MNTLRSVPASVLAVLAAGAQANSFIRAEDDAVIRGWRERQDQILAASQSILDRADAEKRELTKEEKAEVDQNSLEFESLSGQIETRKRVQAHAALMTAPRGRQTEANDTTASPGADPVRPANQAERRETQAAQTVPAQARRSTSGNFGFRSFGEFAQAVRNASLHGAETDPRLVRNAATTYSSEGVGADGGFGVPPDYRPAIIQKVMGEDSLISRCDQLETGSNNMTFPKDETTPWQTTGGVQAYWEGEGDAANASKVALQAVNVRLHKLMALVPVTEELLADGAALDSYLGRKAPEKIDFKVSNAIFAGSGVGQPLGILNSGALVTVSKESSQAADTVLAENIFKMWSRMYAPCRRNAIWLINQDVEPQLFGMTVKVKNVAGTENVGGSAIYIPPGGINNSPYGLLMGRPVVVSEVCKTIGDVGDVVLADMTKYLAATKSGGIRSDVSIHLYFDQDISAFRFIFRVGGQPWWTAPISRANGSNTLSAFVALEAR